MKYVLILISGLFCTLNALATVPLDAFVGTYEISSKLCLRDGKPSDYDCALDSFSVTKQSGELVLIEWIGGTEQRTTLWSGKRTVAPGFIAESRLEINDPKLITWYYQAADQNGKLIGKRTLSLMSLGDRRFSYTNRQIDYIGYPQPLTVNRTFKLLKK